MSRGLLQIASQRTPYLRAGLSFGSREPLLVDIRTLDGERFLELIQDQVLTITIGDESGNFGALPTLPDDLSTAILQLMIDGMIADLGPADAPAPKIEHGNIDDALVERAKAAGYSSVPTLIDGVFTLVDHIRSGGYASVDALLQAHTAAVTFADSVAKILGEAGIGEDDDALSWLATKLGVEAGQAQIIADLHRALDAANERCSTFADRDSGWSSQNSDLLDKVSKLEAEIADLKANGAANRGRPPRQGSSGQGSGGHQPKAPKPAATGTSA